jgi:hypothetical protein
MNTIKEKFLDKSGIAFIITLGLLGLLMITAVTFVVFMKTEREATSNTFLVKRTRQLALSGVADAMAEISHSIQDDWYPSTNRGWYISSPLLDADVDSEDSKVLGGVESTDAYKNLRSDIYYSQPSFLDLLPKEMFENSLKFCQIDAYKIANDKYNVYKEIFDEDESRVTEYKGNFSYIIVNLSGTLDPNFAGRAGDQRGIGGRPYDFDLTQLPSLEGSYQGSTNVFVQDREVNGEFETLVDVADAPGIETAKMKCLYPFSMFVTKDNDTTFDGVKTNHTEYSAMNKSDDYIDDFDKIITDECGVEGIDYGSFSKAYTKFFNKMDNMTVFMNLVDYLDGDNLPGGIDDYEDPDPDSSGGGYLSPCVEAFPMINEVSCKPSFTEVKIIGDMYTAEYNLEDLSVELWYPFVSPLMSEVYNNTDLELWFYFEFPPIQKGIDIFPSKVKLSGEIADTEDSDDVARTVEFAFPISNFSNFKSENQAKLFKFDAISVPTNVVLNKTFDFTVYLQVKVINKASYLTDDPRYPDGYILDGTPAVIKTTDDRLTFGEEHVLKGIPDDEFDELIDQEVSDPRLNYLPDQWTKSANKTEDAINAATTVPDADVGYGMFVKGYQDKQIFTDVPGLEHPANLESLGELGFLFTGLPWQTIKLTGDDSKRAKIYENLFFEGDLTGSGYANINTEYKDVLKAALNDLPVLTDAGIQKLDDPATLDKLVDTLADLTDDGGISPTNLFDSSTQTAIFTALNVQNSSDIEKEAFYISGYPAFNSRQQLFAIISKGYVNNSAQYCIAIVWRDPVADEDGYHKCFIREVTWLNNKY